MRAEAGFGESLVANAEIDLTSVRRARARPGRANVLSRQRLELFAQAYSRSVYPPNSMLDASGALRVPERSHFVAMQMQAIQMLRQRGVVNE